MRRANDVIVWLGALLLWSMLPASAQTVVLETNHPRALVYADSVYLGPASQGRFDLPAGSRAFRLVAPGIDTWSVPPLAAPLEAAAEGDTLHVALHFPYRYRIETVPFGATVYAETPEGRLRLGETPLLVEQDQPLTDRLIVERRGYVAEPVEPGAAIWNRVVLPLRPALRLDAPAAEVDWTPPRERRRWIDAAALGLAVAGGALAVHYKFKADALYDDFRVTQDAALQPRIEAFDRRAAYGLGAMQVGVGIFAVRLVLR